MQVTRLAIGLTAWAIAWTVWPAPPAARALLLVPLLLVPLKMAAESRSLTSILALVAALPLVAAYAMQQGPTATALALPWLAVCFLAAALAALDGLRGLPGIVGVSQTERLARDAAYVLLAVGAAFVAIERSGLQLLGLDTRIVLITGVHFHVLGFGLMAVIGSLADRGSRVAYPATLSLLIGIPLTAAGFSIDSTLLQLVGAVPVVMGGLLAALALALARVPRPGWRRGATLVSAAALVVGVPMGLIWAAAIQFGFGFVDFGTMVATHGALNTLGIALAALSLWTEHE